MFAEKVLPVGERLARLIAVVLIALRGLGRDSLPASVPGLTRPGGMENMHSMLGCRQG